MTGRNEKSTTKKKAHPEASRPARPAGSLRMKELAQAVGLPKSAILHYISQGLLPEPTRTGTNMAYYDPSCIERIKFIKNIQSRYAFPLNRIKTLIAKKDEGVDLAPLLELNEAVFTGSDGPILGTDAFCEATGLKPAEVIALKKDGLLLPLEKNRYNQQDVTIGKIYAQGFAMGIKVTDLSYYAEAARQIVDAEMKLRSRLTANLPVDRDAVLTRRLVNVARTTRNYVIDRTFQLRIASAAHLRDERLLSQHT